MWQETLFRLLTRVYDMLHRPAAAAPKRRGPWQEVLSALRVATVVGLAITAAIIIAMALTTTPPPSGPPGTIPTRVIEWMSGDIVRLENDTRRGFRGRHGVRLAGIDAPENYASKHSHTQARRMRLELLQLIRLGFKAQEFVQTALPYGSTVHVEWDLKTRDPEGMPLVFLWADERRLVQEEILRAGWADLDPATAWKHSQRLRKARDQARTARKGIWQVVR